MTRSVSDDAVQAALTTWAKESLAGTTARSFSVTDAEATRNVARSRRRMLPAVAAAAVLVVVAVSVAVGHIGHQKTLPATISLRCPRQVPQGVPLHSDGRPLFTRPVAEMTACSYADLRHSRPVAAVPLGHRLSAELAQHLNHAPTTSNGSTQCLELTSVSVLLARDVQGNPLPPVTLIPGCRVLAATNGTSTRYFDTLDPAFEQAEQYVSRHR